MTIRYIICVPYFKANFSSPCVVPMVSFQSCFGEADLRVRSRGCLSAEKGLGVQAATIGFSHLCSAMLCLDDTVDISEQDAHEHPMLRGLPGQTYLLFEEASAYGQPFSSSLA